MTNWIKFIFLLCNLFITPLVCAENLIQVYQQALTCDPLFQSARAAYLATAEAVPQSIANLLPNANVTGSTAKQEMNIDILNRTFFPDTVPPTLTRIYNTNGYTLTLTQTLFNFASFIQVKQAKATVKQACANYGYALQDLVMRVSQAYFNALLAQDNLRYIQAKKLSIEKQLFQIRERYKVGLETITTLEEAKASYDRTVAEEIKAQNNILNSLEKLKQITNIYYDHLAPLKNDMPLLNPRPNDSDQWVCAAERRNLKLEASRYAMQAAKEKIKISFAGHLPVINAVGTSERQNHTFFDTINLTTNSAQLQVALPIYSGGAVNSLVRQAKYEYQKASADMEATHREVVATTREAFNNVIAGISKIKADKQALTSSQSALDANQVAFKVGTRTMVDVLLAQKNLLDTQQMYASDEYDYLINTLSLKQMAGTLTPSDLCEINRWLAPEKPFDQSIEESR